MINKSVLAIPHWLQEKMTRHQLALSSLNKPDQLLKILSVEELATILSLNLMICRSAAFDRNGGRRHFDLYEIWRRGDPANFQLVDMLAFSKDIENEVNERLHSSNALSEDDPNKGTLYRINDCEREFCVLVVYPGFMESLALPRFQYSLFKRLLDIFCVYYGALGAVKCYELPLFGAYIRLLSDLSKA